MRMGEGWKETNEKWKDEIRGRERQNKDNEIEERRIKTDRKRRKQQPEAVKAFEPSSV